MRVGLVAPQLGAFVARAHLIGQSPRPGAGTTAVAQSRSQYAKECSETPDRLALSLLVTAGWLSLLAATSLTDLGRLDAASAYLRTAAQLADEAEHTELRAWCLETRAWQALIGSRHQQAAILARGAQDVAPHGSSAFVQATAQAGRAWARLGAVPETLDALARVEALVSPMPVPDQPEHHFRYDPGKSEAYVATTLTWLGDPAAVGVARGVLRRIESGADGTVRPRRAATARLDLALALAAADQVDEAAGIAQEAIGSGLLVQSHMWRAEEVIAAVGEHDPDGATSLREAKERWCARRH